MDFKSDLAHISMDEKLDLHHLDEVYNQKLAEILDKHAPLKSKTLKITHIQPWFDDKIRMEKLLRRRLEWRWLQDPTQYNLQSFYYQRRHAVNVIKAAQNTTTMRRLQSVVMIPKLFSGYSTPSSEEMTYYHYPQQLATKPFQMISTTSLLKK